MDKVEKTATEKGAIMVIEDEAHLRQGITDFLTRRGYEVHAAANGDRAIELLSEVVVDVILTDMKMKGLSNLSLVDALQEKAPDVQIIVMTAFGTIQQAVDAMKRGIYDYLTKPLNLDELLIYLEKALEKKRLQQEIDTLRQELYLRHSFGNIIGKSYKMQEVYQNIEKVAATNATVLILGESGTGKQMVASAIHYNSLRKNGPFVTLTCSSIPESLLASEIFGYEKGAFTGAQTTKIGKFEAAHNGTLFIDEVSEIDAGVQVSLLRFLQERNFERVGGNQTISADVRVIAASNKDLYEEIKKGNFREDLYYRLNVLPIYLAPLRERKEDIPLLAEHLLRKYVKENNKDIKGFTTEAILLLMSYDWPGNVRELENIIERAVIMTDGPWIHSSQLLPHLSGEDILAKEVAFGENLRLDNNFEHVEKYLIVRALDETQGNKTKAAELLGITYRALRYKLDRYGFDKGDAE